MARPKKEVKSENVELETPQTDNQIEQRNDESDVQVQNETTTQDANPTLEQNNDNNEDQTDDSSEQSSQDGITVLQFRSMAVTYPDVDKLFQKEKGNLKNPKAVAEDMRRLGHYVNYE